VKAFVWRHDSLVNKTRENKYVDQGRNMSGNTNKQTKTVERRNIPYRWTDT